MERRKFLITSGGVCAAIMSGLIASEPQRKLKAGFLGASHSHAFDKYRVVSKNPNFEIVGIAETKPTALERFKSLSPKYLNREDLLAQSDVIIVESDVASHARDARAALEAGKHVHVEKPPTASLKEMEELVSLARDKSLVMQVSFMWRFNPGVQKILSLVRTGALGEVYLVRGVMNSHTRGASRKPWAEFKGGGMFEQGSHLIDIFVRLLGAPKKVTSFLRNDGDDDGLKDNNLAVLEYPKGMAILANTTMQPNPFEHRTLEVFGTLGTVTLRPLEPPTLRLDLLQAAADYKAGQTSVSWPFERYTGEFAELAEVILRKSKPTVTLEEELVIQRVVLEASGMI